MKDKRRGVVFHKNSVDYYKDRFIKAGAKSAIAVGWKNDTAQEMRFEQLIKLIRVKSGFSINDLGCGYGHLFNYMTNKGFTDYKYYGLDISERCILENKKQRNNRSCQFEVIDECYSNLKPRDYTVASGIFSLIFDISKERWERYILDTLQVMNFNSTKGFAFNMLTTYSDRKYMKDDLYYANPCYYFDLCKCNYSRNVALLHDYEEYDFTIIVRK